jgi:hypothetical protein
MGKRNCTAADVGLIRIVVLLMLATGCRQDIPPPVTRSLPSGIGGLNSSPVGGDDWAGKGTLVPGIDFCSFAGSSGLDDFVFFAWGDFNGGAARTESKNKDGLQFHGHLINDPEKRHVEFAGETKDGKTGHVTIEGNKYDLADGTLFLVSSRRGYVVKQLKRDLTRFQDADELFKELSKSDPDVLDFFRPTEVAK